MREREIATQLTSLHFTVSFHHALIWNLANVVKVQVVVYKSTLAIEMLSTIQN